MTTKEALDKVVNDLKGRADDAMKRIQDINTKIEKTGYSVELYREKALCMREHTTLYRAYVHALSIELDAKNDALKEWAQV